MKLELFDTYNIRVRLSSSIILFSPLAITLFLCFDDLNSLASSSVLISVLLAFTNYLPILQRRVYKEKFPYRNYAVEFLQTNDKTLLPVTKKRYYTKLASIDPAFAYFSHPDKSETFISCCQGAVTYLRNHSRNNPMVLEENINRGFCKNLWISKRIGIFISFVSAAGIAIYSWIKYKHLPSIPTPNYFSFFFDIAVLCFWIFGINREMLQDAAKRYAKALLSSIDSLDIH